MEESGEKDLFIHTALLITVIGHDRTDSIQSNDHLFLQHQQVIQRHRKAPALESQTKDTLLLELLQENIPLTRAPQ